MGKHKKRLRAERAKVKLKKTPLPKGGNVTDTSFKAKKIVIVEQMKSPGANEIVSSKNLTVKDLLSQLQHYNTTKRLNGLSGIEELLKTQAQELLKNKLNPVIAGIMHVLLDIEQTPRRSAINILKQMFQKLQDLYSIELLTPLHKIIIKHLTCAMTHINNNIQNDSLLLIDVLLEYVPEIIVKNAKIILSHLSNRCGMSYKLTVLSRIYKILTLIFSIDTASNPVGTHKSLDYDKSKYLNIFISEYDYSLIDADVTGKSLSSDHESYQENVSNCMIIFLNSWVEVSPLENSIGVVENSLEPNAMNVLIMLSNVIELFYTQAEKIDNSKRNQELQTWFKKKYKDNIRTIVSGLPYSLIKISKKGQSDTTISQEDVTRANLTLCSFYHLFKLGIDVDNIYLYVSKCIRNIQANFTNRLFKVIKVMLLNPTHQAKNLTILLTVIKMYKQTSDSEMKTDILDLIVTVALDPRLNLIQEEPTFKNLLENIILKLCQNPISLDFIKTIHTLCVRCSIVRNSLNTVIFQVLKFLPGIEVVGCDKITCQKYILYLLTFCSEKIILQVINSNILSRLTEEVKESLESILLYEFPRLYNGSNKCFLNTDGVSEALSLDS